MLSLPLIHSFFPVFMQNAKFYAAAGLLFAFGAGCAAPYQSPAPAKTTNTPALQGEVTLGAILPLTGDGAAYGLPIQKAVNLAVDEINAAGGVGGKKLVVATEDGKCDGKAGAVAAQKLISVMNVPAIIGGACSGETLGFAPIANEQKRVVISPSATSPDITTKGGDYVFRFAPSDALAGKIAAFYALKELGAKRAAIVSENTDYAQGLRKVFFKTFDENGGGIVIDEPYNTGATDFRTVALKIKNGHIDVVYIVPQTPAPGLAIVKALKDQKVEVKLLSSEIFLGLEVAKNNKETLEGVTGFEAFFDDQSVAAKKFADAYKTKYNEELAWPFYQANAYSEVYALKALIENVGASGEKLQAELARLKNWSGGALTNVTLDKDGDIEWKTYSVKKITNGIPTQVKTVTME